MNQRLASTLVSLSLLFALPFSAAASEPAPIAKIKFRGEELPLYSSKDLPALKTVKPVYPAAERDNKVQGFAEIVALVGPDGKVKETVVRSSSPVPSFGQAAQESVAKWRFPIVKRNGEAASYLVTTPVVFSISG